MIKIKYDKNTNINIGGSIIPLIREDYVELLYANAKPCYWFNLITLKNKNKQKKTYIYYKLKRLYKRIIGFSKKYNSYNICLPKEFYIYITEQSFNFKPPKLLFKLLKNPCNYIFYNSKNKINVPDIEIYESTEERNSVLTNNTDVSLFLGIGDKLGKIFYIFEIQEKSSIILCDNIMIALFTTESYDKEGFITGWSKNNWILINLTLNDFYDHIFYIDNNNFLNKTQNTKLISQYNNDIQIFKYQIINKNNKNLRNRQK